MKKRGIYKIRDEFFSDFPDPYLKTNKNENRPCYYCLMEQSTGLLWMIPLSKQIDKYKAIIKNKLKNKKPCDILHVAKLDDGRESAFLIQDMFPTIESYIAGEYTINGTILAVTSDALASVLERKAKTVLLLIRKGVRFLNTQPNVLSIEKDLLVLLSKERRKVNFHGKILTIRRTKNSIRLRNCNGHPARGSHGRK